MVSPSTTDLTRTGSANSMVVVVGSLGLLGSVVSALSLGSESSVVFVVLLCRVLPAREGNKRKAQADAESSH